MKNADMPAMPIVDSCGGPAMYGSEGVEALGLTKREMMAMNALTGLIAAPDLGAGVTADDIVNAAVNYADALLAALEEKQ